MGRREQKEREKKRAAATCQTLEQFLPPKKRTTVITDATASSPSEPSIPATPDHSPELSTSTEGTEDLQCSSGELHTDIDELTCQQQSVGPVDIGDIYLQAKSSREFCNAVQALTIRQKYDLLKNHKKPHKEQVFPTQHLGGCNRSFRHMWLSEHPWMVYSEQVDGVFCIACALFRADPSRGKFVTKPFRVWNKKSEKVKEHEHCLYHQSALENSDHLKQTVEHPHTSIVAQVDARKAANIKSNRAVLKSIARAVLFCGRQCIALRGDCEKLADGDSSVNPGNFLALLKLLATNDEVLRKHLEAPTMRCATYISPQIQNELIGVMGKHMILQGILDDMNAAPYYTILADEVTSHNIEHLAICARFVDGNKDIREEFLCFLELDRITGEKIALAILQFLREHNIPIANMRGQGYDGASNMSSGRVGVQARIMQEAPLATYVHCNGHCLNLVISKSCALPQVRNVIDRLQNCCRYFLNSPKRNGVLELIVSHNVVEQTKRKPLLDLCKTRWAERHSAYQHFYQSFVSIVEALELIGFKRHLAKYGNTYADWDPTSRSDAQQILASITSYEFIVVFVTIYQYMSHLSGITVKLQKTALDIIEAHEMVTEVASIYQVERNNVDSSFAPIYAQSVRMAERVESTIGMPRIASRQQHRSNTEASSPCEYFQRNIAIPFLDHIIMCLNQQFSPSTIIATSLLGLVPSVLCSKEVSLAAAVNKYEADLPSPELFQMELKRWKNRYITMPPRQRPTSPATAIKDCDKAMFPNISVLLQIACTIPVTSCECERSASVLRRLNNYMRASMGKGRLSDLALLHIHYNTLIDMDKVVDCFAQLHPRRLELDSLLC